ARQHSTGCRIPYVGLTPPTYTTRAIVYFYDNERIIMKAVVFGATGTIGHHVSRELETLGHEVVRATRGTGVDVYTGQGVREALQGAEIIVDCLNVETISAQRAVDFFTQTAQIVSD